MAITLEFAGSRSRGDWETGFWIILENSLRELAAFISLLMPPTLSSQVQ